MIVVLNMLGEAGLLQNVNCSKDIKHNYCTGLHIKLVRVVSITLKLYFYLKYR